MNENTIVAVNTNTLSGTFGHAILKPNLKQKTKVDPSQELPRLILVSGRSEETTVQVAEKVRTALLTTSLSRIVKYIFSRRYFVNHTDYYVILQIKSYPFDPEYLRLCQDVFGSTMRGYEYKSFVLCPPDPSETVQVAVRSNLL